METITTLAESFALLYLSGLLLMEVSGNVGPLLFRWIPAVIMVMLIMSLLYRIGFVVAL